MAKVGQFLVAIDSGRCLDADEGVGAGAMGATELTRHDPRA
jgi:hypothetical protein